MGYDDVENWTTVNGLSSNVVWSFLPNAQGQLWMATERNLDRINPNNKIEQQLDSQHKPMRRIQTLALSENGHIWSGSDSGNVVDYDPKTGITVSLRKKRAYSKFSRTTRAECGSVRWTACSMSVRPIRMLFRIVLLFRGEDTRGFMEGYRKTTVGFGSSPTPDSFGG